MYVSVLLVYVCVPCKCLVPIEVRRGFCVPAWVYVLLRKPESLNPLEAGVTDSCRPHNGYSCELYTGLTIMGIVV